MVPFALIYDIDLSTQPPSRGENRTQQTAQIPKQRRNLDSMEEGPAKPPHPHKQIRDRAYSGDQRPKRCSCLQLGHAQTTTLQAPAAPGRMSRTRQYLSEMPCIHINPPRPPRLLNDAYRAVDEEVSLKTTMTHAYEPRRDESLLPTVPLQQHDSSTEKTRQHNHKTRTESHDPSTQSDVDTRFDFTPPEPR